MLPKYIQEFGDNAYSAFNAITDFASHPPENRCVYRDRHSYQQLAGAWLRRLHDEYRQKDCSLSDYLVKFAGGDEKRIDMCLKRIEFYAVFLWIYLDNKNEI